MIVMPLGMVTLNTLIAHKSYFSRPSLFAYNLLPFCCMIVKNKGKLIMYQSHFPINRKSFIVQTERYVYHY